MKSLIGSLGIALALASAGACTGGGDDDSTGTGADANRGGPDGGGCPGCINSSGLCVAGTRIDACGAGGETCQECPGGQECADQQCLTPPSCSPDTCDGCCDGDICSSGTSNAACGSGGFGCQNCAAVSGSTCVGQSCAIPCGPDTCSGCCLGGECVGGNADTACGHGGLACETCDGGEACSLGDCVSTVCALECSGCCSGSTCLGGDSTSACGADGGTCLDCGASRLCEEGACVVDPTSRWDVIVVNGELNETNVESEPWDAFGGLPDGYVQLTTSEGPDFLWDNSSTVDNTLTPYWNDVVLSDIPARMLTNYFYIRVYDDDVGATDDDFGNCAPVIDDSSFSDTLLTLDCPRNTEAGKAGFLVRFKIRPH